MIIGDFRCALLDAFVGTDGGTYELHAIECSPGEAALSRGGYIRKRDKGKKCGISIRHSVWNNARFEFNKLRRQLESRRRSQDV